MDQETPSPVCPAWDDGDPRLVAALARVQAHPRFAEAVQALAGAMLAQMDSDRALAGIFKDAGRYVAAMVAASLQRDGVTLARLKQLCAGFGLLSPGRAHAMLAYLAWLGLIEPWPSGSSAAGRMHRVSERFVAAWARHLAGALSAVALIDTRAALMADYLADPVWLDRFTGQQMQGLQESRPEMDAAADIAAVFVERDAGSPLLWWLIAETGWTAGGGRPVAISAARLATRFGVSRMHLSRLLAAARARDLVEDGEAGSCLSPRADAQVAHFFGLQLARLLVSVERTLAT